MAKVHPESVRKWKQTFTFLSGSSEGRHSKQNRDHVIQKFMANEAFKGVKQKDRDIGENLFHDTWKALHNDLESFTCEEFVAQRKELMLFRPGDLALALMKLYRRVFWIVDLNDDGYIDMKEFRIHFEAHGYNDHEIIERAFKAIDKNGDGVITEDEYIDAWIRYDMDTDVKMEDLPVCGIGLPTVDR